MSSAAVESTRCLQSWAGVSGAADALLSRARCRIAQGTRFVRGDGPKIVRRGRGEHLMYVETILARKGWEVRTVGLDTTVSEAMRRMREGRIGALVVSTDGMRIAGILTDRRVMNAIVDRGIGVLDARIEEVMTKEVFTCSPRDRVAAVMGLMTERRIRYMPVVGEDGRLCGIVSTGDAVKYRLEEMRHEVEALQEHIKSIL